MLRRGGPLERLRHRGRAARRVTVRLERGEIVGVIGRNGAGKSTLMQTLIGLLPARRGTVTLNGERLTRLPAEERARRGLGYVPQGRHVFPEMTVLDNLRTGTFIGGGAQAGRTSIWCMATSRCCANARGSSPGH